MKKQVIDPDKIAKTLGVQWSHPQVDIDETGNYRPLNSIYDFFLRESNESPTVMCLSYSLTQPDRIRLEIESGGYRSEIVFQHIEVVTYHPQYRCIEFQRTNGDHFNILKIWWRGQFDFIVG